MTDKFLDTCGLSCPLPILKTKTTLKKMLVGEKLEIASTDEGFIQDIKTFCKQTGNEIISYKKNNAKHLFVIEKLK